MGELAATAGQEVIIEIGGMPVQVRSESPEFLLMLEDRYAGFLNPEADPIFEFDIELVAPMRITEEIACTQYGRT